MKVLFWIPYPSEGASNRYRVEQYLPYLKEAGTVYSVRPFWSSAAFKILYKKGHSVEKLCYFILGTFSRIFDLAQIFRYNIIFIHREAYPIGGAFFETILYIFKKPVIFDFDDAIFLSASSRPNDFIERFKKPGKVASIIKRSESVIAGNSYLCDFALRYNSSTTIIPTPIDTNKYYPDVRNHRDDVVVGWMGSVTTVDFLNPMKDIFINLSKQFHNVRFKIAGGEFFIDGISAITSKPWSLEEELDDLRSFDIGIMPMPDNEWTKGKCGFKAILYMSMGIPTVCSAVGVNSEIIEDGVNGFLASSDKEWIEKLSLLIKDHELRQRLGAAGRRTVEEKYSLKVNAPKYLAVLNKAYEGKRSCHEG